jgi:hypothetical protein
MNRDRIGIIGVLAVLIAGVAAAGTQDKPWEPDLGSIDGVVSALYKAITYDPANPPRLDVMRSLYLPEARFDRMTKDGPNRMSVDEFLAFFENRLKQGTVKTFVEEEIARRTERFGSIAQVFSAYRKGLDTTDRSKFVRGINSLHLIHDGRRWWVASIVWQDESAEHPIPPKYLKND